MRHGPRFERWWLALLGWPLVAFAASANPAWDDALKASQAVIGRALPEDVLQRPMVDTLGRSVRLADFRGAPLVVNFVYTGCFQACPLATQGLAKAVAAARDALGPGSFRVVTIGFNQPFDTPEAMSAFARQAGIRDERWTFASPRAEDVPALARAFGFGWSASPKGFDHITQATIVDARGAVYRQVYGDRPALAQFVGPLRELLGGQAAEAPATLENLWTQVRLFCTVYDPATGGYRTNYSLFFEIFCGLSVLGALGWFIGREWRHARLH